MAFNKFPRSPLVILYPDPVQPRVGAYFRVHDLVNNALTQMGYACDYATEKRVAEGRLKDYRIVVMPQADYIRDETYAAVRKFVSDGGTAVVIGDPPAHDEMDHLRDATFFGVAGGDARLQRVNGTAARDCSRGKGRIYLLPNLPMDAARRNMAPEAAQLVEAFLERVTKAELPPQPVVIRKYENRTIARDQGAEGGRAYLTWICNESLDKEAILTPTYNFKVNGCKDLINCETVDPHRIVIGPVDCRLLQLSVAP